MCISIWLLSFAILCMSFGAYLFGRYIAHLIAQRVINYHYDKLFKKLSDVHASVEVIEIVFNEMEQIVHEL